MTILYHLWFEDGKHRFFEFYLDTLIFAATLSEACRVKAGQPEFPPDSEIGIECLTEPKAIGLPLYNILNFALAEKKIGYIHLKVKTSDELGPLGSGLIEGQARR